MEASYTFTSESFVQVIEATGEWFVRVVDNGVVTSFQSFETDAFATAFADGQRMRLGLSEWQKVTRDTPIDPAVWAEQKVLSQPK